MSAPAQPAAEDGPAVPFDLRALPAEDLYALLTHAVAPRPIAWVSTLSAEGRPNLAPYSYFNVGGQNPPSVVFSPNAGGGGREKDTLRNIRETGEYVIHLASRRQAAAMNATAVDLPHGQSEWDTAGLSPLPSTVVKPDRVAGCPFALECRLFQIVSHGTGPGAANYVIGEVVFAHVERSLLNAAGDLSSLDSALCGGLGRMGGDWYVDGRGAALFELNRPK
ncbi:flavin reductase family protein [Alienimonas californiensis]|nr:flavin reductase family protein [Alienimonas californiensis]